MTSSRDSSGYQQGSSGIPNPCFAGERRSNQPQKCQGFPLPKHVRLVGLFKKRHCNWGHFCSCERAGKEIACSSKPLAHRLALSSQRSVKYISAVQSLLPRDKIHVNVSPASFRLPSWCALGGVVFSIPLGQLDLSSTGLIGGKIYHSINLAQTATLNRRSHRSLLGKLFSVSRGEGTRMTRESRTVVETARKILNLGLQSPSEPSAL